MPIWLANLLMNKYVLGTLIISIIGAFLYGYFVYTQDKIAELNQQNSKQAEQNRAMVVISQENNKTINKLLVNMEDQQKLLSTLRNRTADAEEDKNKLLKKLGEHDLSYLAMRKPGLIENRINDATRKVFDDFESSTAAGD